MKMFTVLFAIARTSGWLSHWNEMLERNTRIARPRQFYIGNATQTLLPLKTDKVQVLFQYLYTLTLMGSTIAAVSERKYLLTK